MHSRVALSNIYALKMMGAEVKLCGPKSLIPKHIEYFRSYSFLRLNAVLNWCDAMQIYFVYRMKEWAQFTFLQIENIVKILD